VNPALADGHRPIGLRRGGRRAVAVYCGADPDTAGALLAASTGRHCVRAGLHVVYGGGAFPGSPMGALADAVLLEDPGPAGDRPITGVIPEWMVAREWAHPRVDDMRQVATMGERLDAFVELADAHLVLLGRIGTLTEWLFVWGLAALGAHQAPVVVCDPDGRWRDVIVAWSAVVKPEDVHRIVVVSTVADALTACVAEPVDQRSAGAV
jgi:hypothetical protein